MFVQIRRQFSPIFFVPIATAARLFTVGPPLHVPLFVAPDAKRATNIHLWLANSVAEPSLYLIGCRSGFSYPGQIFVSAVATVALTICPCCCSCTACECRRCWLCTVLSHPTDLSSAPRILTASGTVLYLCRVVNTLVIT